MSMIGERVPSSAVERRAAVVAHDHQRAARGEQVEGVAAEPRRVGDVLDRHAAGDQVVRAAPGRARRASKTSWTISARTRSEAAASGAADGS